MLQRLWYNIWNKMTVKAFGVRRFKLQYDNEEWSFIPKAGKALPFWLTYGTPEMVRQSMKTVLAMQKAKIVSLRFKENKKLETVWEERKPEAIKCTMTYVDESKTSLSIKISDIVPRSFEESWSRKFVSFLEEYSREYDAEFKISQSKLDLLDVYPGLAADITLHSMAKELVVVNIEGETFFVSEFVENITEKGLMVDETKIIFRF
ncbi:MAG: hypothetical protein CBC55_00830 [Gammaproteobacteria bacterium TMED95]|nr:MAG: hypothetical protein CBC55_00830 [Gammaproteobacteria bacterium TMED95]